MRTMIRRMRTARMAMMLVLAMLTTQTVLAGTKADLAAAISEAETYSSSIEESNPKLAGLLTALISNCKRIHADDDAPQDDIDFAIDLANEGVKQCKVAVAQADYAAVISEAEAYLTTIRDKYPAQGEKLNTIIVNAKTFMENTQVSVLEVLTQAVRLGIQQITLEVAQADYDAAISEAEEYKATLQDKHPEQSQKLANIIDNAKALMDITQLDVLKVLTQSVRLGIQQMQLEVAQADYDAAITDAEAYLATIQETHPDQAQKLTNIIDNAKTMAGTGTSLEVLDFLAKVLNEGIREFKMETAHADLAAAISEAEAYMTSIRADNASLADAMQLFITIAKQVQADDSYELADVEYATVLMKEILAQARELVTTGVSTARVAADMAAKYFDLQGRRVEQPARSRVYINNGKKVVNK